VSSRVKIRRQGISGKLVKRTAAESVHVVGVTENISFSTGRAGSKVYGYGDRDKGVGFAILNWQVRMRRTLLLLPPSRGPSTQPRPPPTAGRKRDRQQAGRRRFPARGVVVGRQWPAIV